MRVRSFSGSSTPPLCAKPVGDVCSSDLVPVVAPSKVPTHSRTGVGTDRGVAHPTSQAPKTRAIERPTSAVTNAPPPCVIEPHDIAAGLPCSELGSARKQLQEEWRSEERR